MFLEEVLLLDLKADILFLTQMRQHKEGISDRFQENQLVITLALSKY